MKKTILAFFLVFLFLSASLSLTAAPASQTKTFSVSTHLAKLMVSGYGLEAEYHGFGPIGIFAGGYHSLYYTMDGLTTDLSGFGFSGGAKYYLNYQKKGLNSFFVAGEYRFLTEDYKDKDGNHQDITRSGFIALFGRRFDFSPVFLELAIGGGPMYVHSVRADDDYQDMSDKQISKLRRSEHKIEGGMDLKLMAGISF